MTNNLYLKLIVRKSISLFDEQGFNISEIKKEKNQAVPLQAILKHFIL